MREWVCILHQAGWHRRSFVSYSSCPCKIFVRDKGFFYFFRKISPKISREIFREIFRKREGRRPQKKEAFYMKLENYQVYLPNYSIGDKIYGNIGPVCESYGKTVLVIGGKKALAAAFDKIKAYVDRTNLVILGKEIYGENCTYAAVERLRNLPLYKEADMVFAVGGGKALDTVKCLCIPDEKPVFAFPTIHSV